MTTEAARVSTRGTANAFPCPECGADTTLAPGTDSLLCEHCGAKTKIVENAKPIHEHDFREGLARLREAPVDQLAVGAKEIMCKTCGSRTVVTQQATRCPFCDDAMVVEVDGVNPTIIPESVLPFGLDKSAAGEKFQVWLRKRWFAPFDLVKRAKREGLDGVYLPYWTYDSHTTTDYTGQRGEHYYETEEYTDSQGKRQTRQVQKTRWYSASGTVDVGFNDVLVCATPSLPATIIDKLEPWDLPQLRAYDGKYLAGFIAERYRIDLESGFTIAEARMEPQIRAAIEGDIGGDEQRIYTTKIRHSNTTFKHVLLPLWMSSFRYGENVYRVTVNARTGEVAGERPWSAFKIAVLCIVIAAIIVAIVYVATMNNTS